LDDFETLTLGKCDLGFVVAYNEGKDLNGIKPLSVETEITEEEFRLPKEFQEHIEQHNIRHFLNSNFFNGHQYGIRFYKEKIDNHSEDRTLLIGLKNTRYYDLLCTHYSAGMKKEKGLLLRFR
jgi:hypothetical protein